MVGRFGTTAAHYLRCLRFIISPSLRHLDTPSRIPFAQEALVMTLLRLLEEILDVHYDRQSGQRSIRGPIQFQNLLVS